MRAWEVSIVLGYPSDQDSKTVKAYSQAGLGIFIEKISRVSRCQRQIQRA